MPCCLRLLIRALMQPKSSVFLTKLPTLFYVTETSTVNILLPIQIHEKHHFQGYLEFFDKAVLATKENAQMTVIFVYSSEAAKKLEGADDPFGEQKKMLENLEKKYRQLHNNFLNYTKSRNLFAF